MFKLRNLPFLKIKKLHFTVSQLFDNCSCELWKKYSTFVSKGFKLSFCLFFCFVKKVFKANVNLMVVHFVCTFDVHTKVIMCQPDRLCFT